MRTSAAREFRVRYAELSRCRGARLHERRLHRRRQRRCLLSMCSTLAAGRAGPARAAAGRGAAAGFVLGVDISALVLELARRLTDREGLRNVSYRLADASGGRLSFWAYRYDVCISCFGVMFFAGTAAAFASRRARAASRRGAWRCWSGKFPERKRVVQRDRRGRTARRCCSAAPGCSHLPEQHTTAGDTGGGRIHRRRLRHRRARARSPYYGGDSAGQAYDFATGPQATKDMLASLDPAAADGDAARLHVITARLRDPPDGSGSKARSWVITAHNTAN